VNRLPAPPAGAPQPPAGGPPSAGRPGPRFDLLARLSTELKLTEAQQAKIKPILDSQLAQMRTIGTNQSLTPEQKRTKIMALANANRTKIRKILTPDQQKKWDQILARMRGGQPVSPGGPGGPARPGGTPPRP
jgi:Spy/CpxP family protein refolding chaperone